LVNYKIGVIPGDGIGPEVIDCALSVLSKTGVSYELVEFFLGADAYIKEKVVLPEKDLEKMRELDAILLGAIGPPVGSKEVPPGLLERGLLLKMRFELDLYINLRPFKGVKGSVGQGADFVVVRENTEGAYVGEGGIFKKGTPYEVALQGSVNTYHGVKRCVKYAFELAQKRNKKITLVHKTNVLTYAGDLWQRVFDEISKEFPEVSCDYNHVDAACIYLVENPKRYDVIVTDNLFGDIITDLAGAVSGGIGFAASGNLNPLKTGPSLFEPVHGAAHDIKGTNKANPLAAIASVAMMLDFLGETSCADKISRAVDDVAQLIASMAQKPGTKEITAMVEERME
jgi:3-isopropylmalate dehydrogenase